MKASILSLLCGASLAAAQQQQVLGKQQTVYDRLQKVEHNAWEKIQQAVPDKQSLENKIKNLQDDIADMTDDLFHSIPEKIDVESFLPPPKPHTRKHDSEWDHIVRGADVESLHTTNSQGDKERQIDGDLAAYDMRIKAVDPSELGIDKVKQYSGYLDDKENDKHLFYWFFESRNDPKNDPVVLWLNGGPGCSSLTGLFLELGPGFINKSVEAYNNPFSWNKNASVIFLDQPVNVGYSYSSSSVSNTVAAGKDVYALMSLFFKQFPQYGKQDFHIAGESYAGHYIPQFASEMLAHKNSNINLKSVLIGNGLTDPYTQYAYYRPMACGEGGWPAVLDESECQSMDNALPRCQSLIKTCVDSDSSWACIPASIYCNNALIGPYQRTGKNPYDVRIPCEDGNLCYTQLDWISEYLNKPNVMKALGAEVDSYEGCNMDINRNFVMAGDWVKPFQKLVPGLLEKIPVLIYAGDADFICNWLGNLAWTNELEWPGQSGYKKAKMAPLTLSSSKKHEEVGAFKSSGNFTFVRIHAAGHMVPLDQPEASLDMLNRWLDGEWLEKN